MSWLSNSLGSSIGKKLLMSITGIFIIVFVAVHVSGNSLLFKNDGGLAFNAYSSLMSTNPLIQMVSKVNYALILLHVIYAIVLTRKNQSARPVGYAIPGGSVSSSWASRNMMLLGIILFVFLIIHLRGFWYEMHYGNLGLDSNGNKDLYAIVVAAYSQWWYAGIYVISMIALSFHLSHGFSSTFQSLGLNHTKYTPFIKLVGRLFSIIVPLLFALMPIYLFLKG